MWFETVTRAGYPLTKLCMVPELFWLIIALILLHLMLVCSAMNLWHREKGVATTRTNISLPHIFVFGCVMYLAYRGFSGGFENEFDGDYYYESLFALPAWMHYVLAALGYVFVVSCWATHHYLTKGILDLPHFACDSETDGEAVIVFALLFPFLFLPNLVRVVIGYCKLKYKNK